MSFICYLCAKNKAQIKTESDMWLCISCMEQHFPEEALLDFIAKAKEEAEKPKKCSSCSSCSCDKAVDKAIEEKKTEEYIPFSGDDAFMNML